MGLASQDFKNGECNGIHTGDNTVVLQLPTISDVACQPLKYPFGTNF